MYQKNYVNKIRFVARSDNSQNSVQIEYNYKTNFNASKIVQECKSNSDGSSPPCSNIINLYIQKDDDKINISDDVECCPPDDGVIPSNNMKTLRIENSGNYNIDKKDTLIIQYLPTHKSCEQVKVNANGDGSKNTQSCYKQK